MIYFIHRRDRMKKPEIKAHDKDRIKGIITNIIDSQKKDAFIGDNYKNIPRKGKEYTINLSR
jgi:hypothetical protein